MKWACFTLIVLLASSVQQQAAASGKPKQGSHADPWRWF
jgi:hypothetical protein